MFDLSVFVKGPKSKLLPCAPFAAVSWTIWSFGGKKFCSFGIDGTEGMSEVSQSNRDPPETVDVDLVRVYTELEPEGLRMWDFTVPELKGREKSLLLLIEGLFLCADTLWSSALPPLTFNGPGVILSILFNMLPALLLLLLLIGSRVSKSCFGHSLLPASGGNVWGLLKAVGVVVLGFTVGKTGKALA